MFKRVLLGVVAALTYNSAFAAWDFRGEPNNWGSTRLTAVAGDANKFVIRQTFSSTQDEFKIAKDAAWNESYPAQNFKVAAGKTYDITFFQNCFSSLLLNSNAIIIGKVTLASSGLHSLSRRLGSNEIFTPCFLAY